MSTLVSDENYAAVQAFRLPLAGATTNLTTISALSVSTAPLSAGIYRILSGADIRVAQGAAAAATDMLLKANVAEYFYVNANTAVSVFDPGVGAAMVTLTRMP